MLRLSISLLISFFLVFLQGLKAQTVDKDNQAKKEIAQKNFDSYKKTALIFDKQLNAIDSTYQAASQQYESSLNTFKKAKRAFKYLESNYKAELLPYQKKAKSKNRKEAMEARRMLQIIKTRFQDNGTKTAKIANDASREMLRAQKIMDRAVSRSELIIPRLKKTLEQIDKWEQILLQLEEY